MNFSYKSGNYSRKFNSVTFFHTISTEIGEKIGRKLNDIELQVVSDKIKNIDPRFLTSDKVDETETQLINFLADKFKNFTCEIDEPDIHELNTKMIGRTSETGTVHYIYDNPNYKNPHAFKATPKSKPVVKKTIPAKKNNNTVVKTNNTSIDTSEMVTVLKDLKKLVETQSSIISAFDTTNIYNTARILNPQSKKRENHIFLDSRYRLLDEQSPTEIREFKWFYAPGTAALSEGSVNMIGNTRDIIAIRVHPFRIPYTETADNRYSRISMLINELTGQSFIAHENRNFHFMFKTTIDSEFIDLEAEVFNGYFKFEKPITTLNTITLSFGNPLEQIIFDRDRDVCTFDYISNAPDTLITTEKDHDLSNGDRVYISNFDVGSVPPALIQQNEINQRIKSEINKKNGHLVTVVSSNQFTIPFDSSNIQNPITNLASNVYYGSKRIFIPIDIIYITPDRD